MLLFTTQAKVAIALTLLLVWAYQNYKHRHEHNPLITNNVIAYQNDHRNISRYRGHLHILVNFLNAKKRSGKRTETK